MIVLGMRIMNRRELLTSSLSATGIMMLPVVAYASPQRLYHHECSLRHFDVHDETRALDSFALSMRIRRARAYSDREEDERTYHVMALAKDAAIPVRIFHTVEPSDYFDNYRKVVYHLRTDSPADQARINKMFASIPVSSFEQQYTGSEITHWVWVGGNG